MNNEFLLTFYVVSIFVFVTVVGVRVNATKKEIDNLKAVIVQMSRDIDQIKRVTDRVDISSK